MPTMQVIFRLKKQPEKVVPDLGDITISLLERDSVTPITIKQLNNLSEAIKRRVYRGLLSPALLTRFGVDPITWMDSEKNELVTLKADSGSGVVFLSAQRTSSPTDEFFTLELADNAYNGIDLNLLVLSDPSAPRFETDYDADGNPTMFGTLRRNLEAEKNAKEAGLAPGQVRSGLSSSKGVFEQVESFLSTLGHRAYFLEPLTYASAQVFERRGFAYVRGHKLMDDIHREFQPGGRLHACLDGSTPFRQPDQWNSIRGRAWAIHDGVLSALDANWDKFRMVKQIGKHAGVTTFPNAAY